jgi:8-oxo-dGTP pyrophosphatase MutT (NUDIX family)
MRELSFPAPSMAEVRQALDQSLPGMAAQIKMAPEGVDGQPERWEKVTYYREAGVLLLLYPHSTLAYPELHLALIRRTEYPGVHSGQISLPGGRREEGETLQTTALRETWEEVGVLPETLQVVGQLSSLYTPPSKFCIHPFVAFSATRPAFRLEPKEVAELIETPLRLLLDPATRQQEIWSFPQYNKRRVPFFMVLGHKVWGATAMILSEFLALLKNK